MTDDLMRVLVFDGPRSFHISNRLRPEPGPDEVRVRIAYVGLCGSDLHGYAGESGRRVAGMVMGHEASGWVEAVGSGVDSLVVGERVTFNPSIPCKGECGHVVDNHCSRLKVIGVTPQLQGAFADAITIPADRCVALGDLDLVRGATVEPMAVAIQAASRAGVREGERVLVIGGGMIGQCIAQASRLAGAAEVVVSESLPSRRGLAETAGFSTVAPEDFDELASFDRAFDAVGVTATVTAAVRSVVRGGTVCMVGLGVPEVTLPLFDVVVPELSLIGSFCYTDAVFEEAVGLLSDGRVDTQALIGPTVTFEETPAAFEELTNGARDDVKILTTTGQDAPRATRDEVREPGVPTPGSM